ncbi:MAG: ABC transporter permease [Coriobacteriales bacterium]|jgi:ABC-type dipeptide/oligopeptide/nickel transport system permease subunit
MSDEKKLENSGSRLWNNRAGGGELFSRHKSRRYGKIKNRRLELRILISLVIGLIIVAIFGENLAPHDPFATSSDMVYLPPSWEYPLGTDSLGRCMLCRIIVGLRSSLLSAVVVVACAFALGTFLGIAAGYFGGWIDRVVMWLITSFQTFPSFLLAVVIAGFLGTGIENACIALIVVYWTTFARMSRSVVISLKERTFIKAAELSGCSNARIITRHILPNISSYMLVIATGDVGSVILSMAGLSYLGLGMVRPTSDLGVMLAESQSQLFVAPQIMIMVGVCLSLLVLLFNLLGDALRDYLEDREKAAEINA